MSNFDHEGTDEIVCPHCDHVHRDSWEFSGDDGEIECYECGEKFHYTRDVYVTYSTSK